MTTLLACVDEKVIILDQLETDGRKNIEFLLGLACV